MHAALKSDLALRIKVGTSAVHGYAIKDDEALETRKVLGWDHPPFEIPGDVSEAWTSVGKRGGEPRSAWQSRLAAAPDDVRTEFERRDARNLPAALQSAISDHKKALSEAAKDVATRAASEQALAVINEVLPETIGGSADLTGSNNTKTKSLRCSDR